MGILKSMRYVLLITSAILPHSHSLDSKTAMLRELTDILLHSDTRYIDPIIKVTTPSFYSLKVDISMALRNLIDFDVSRGNLQLFVIFRWRWRDKSLAWNYDKYPVRNIYLPKNKIWMPTMYVQNTAKSIKPLGEAESVLVTPDGICIYTTPQIFDVLCSPDVSRFPFDSHICAITFAPLVEENGFTVVMDNDISQTDMWENSVWNLTFINVTRKNDKIVEVYLKVERYAFFLMLNLVAPLLILSILNVFVFVLPQESGERMSFSITIHLSFVVFITFTSESLPESKNTICVFNLYLLAELVESALITLSSIFLSLLYNLPEDKPIPQAILILCCKRRKPLILPVQDQKKDIAEGMVNNDKKAAPMQHESEEKSTLTWSKITFRLNIGCLIFFTLISLITKAITFGIIAN